MPTMEMATNTGRERWKRGGRVRLILIMVWMREIPLILNISLRLKVTNVNVKSHKPVEMTDTISAALEDSDFSIKSQRAYKNTI